jgi:copper chaperone CopZ
MRTGFILCMALSFLALPSLAAPACKSERLVVAVDGMVCDFCAQSVKKVLEKEDGVKDVAIDLSAKTVAFDMQENKHMSESYVTELIRQAGYKATKVTKSCAG